MTQIAVDNGFSSASHFSNEIKTLFGITPTEFRRIGHIFMNIKNKIYCIIGIIIFIAFSSPTQAAEGKVIIHIR
ncbi:helix-turn-helix domain-containing protein [Enterobacter hormaechei]